MRSQKTLLALVAVFVPILWMTQLGSSAWSVNEVNIKGKPRIGVVLQDSTATFTASWTYAGRVDANWQMLDEWRSSRISGGDNWDLTGTSPSRTATFVVSRSTGSDALGEFCVTAVRVSPQPSRSNSEKCASFVVPMEVLPPVELDSVTINVAGGFLSRVGLSPTISVPVNSLPGEQIPLFPGEKVQFTALLWKDGIVVGCSEGGDCDGYPQASIRMPYHDLYQAYLKSNGGDKLAALHEGGNDG